MRMPAPLRHGATVIKFDTRSAVVPSPGMSRMLTTAAFQPFELEQYQSRFEHSVDLNLADSSVKCLGTREWLSEPEQQQLLDTGLFYPQVNGTNDLRRAIAAMYPGARLENVLVTVGAAQANSMVAATLLRPDDDVVVVSPGYRQIWGLAKSMGCEVHELRLRPEHDWRPDLDELDALVSPRTRLVSVVNPNNPTGVAFTAEEMARVVAACERVGAWLHADEVYRGTERAGAETPSFWGSYARLVCTGSMSKAYGLAGLRIGWAIADPDTIEALWRRHEYATIAAAAPSMTLAAIALQPVKRATLLERQRALSRAGARVLDEWLAGQGGRFSARPSAATCIGFVRYEMPVPSLEFAEHIRRTQSVLVAPGGFLGAEQHLRITLGYEPAKVRAGLDRIASAADSLAGVAASAE
jgi:aspartate/methionine/tyrosine aminotransferase